MRTLCSLTQIKCSFFPPQDKKSVEDLAKEGIPHDLIDMLHGVADSVG